MFLSVLDIFKIGASGVVPGVRNWFDIARGRVPRARPIFR